MRESSHSFPGLNRACVVISSQLYDRRAIDSPLPTLPLLTSLQHLAYLTSTSPRIREILTVDGGLERLITIVGGCLDLAFPETARPKPSLNAAIASASKRRMIPFKPFAAYANCSIEASQRWVDIQAVLHTYGFALQCLVNVGVRGSEQIRTRVVEAGVLSMVARILSGFLGNRQKERERRLALLEPQKSVTLWREDGQQQQEEQEQQGQTVISAPTATSIMQDYQLSYNNPASVSLQHDTRHAPSSSLQTVSSDLMPPATFLPHQYVYNHLLSSQPATLPPSASRLPHLPLNRTNTPDTIASIDEVEAESSGQENEEQMDTEEETGSTASGSVSRSVSRSRRGTITRVVMKDDGDNDVVDEVVVDSAVQAGQAAPDISMTRRGQQEDESMVTPTTREAVLQDINRTGSLVRDEDGDIIMEARYHHQASSIQPQFVEATPLATTHHTTALRVPGATTPLSRQNPYQQQAREAHSRASSSASSTGAAAGTSTSGTHVPSHSFGHSSDHLFKEDDVLHCLHLLAYLSKYPHVRAVFHDPENETCRPPQSPSVGSSSSVFPDSHGAEAREGCPRKKQRCGENGEACSSSCNEAHAGEQEEDEDESNGHMQDEACGSAAGPSQRRHSHRHDKSAHPAGSDEEDCDNDDNTDEAARIRAQARAMAAIPLKDRKPAAEPSRPPRSTANNVFSLVEQFTFRPSGPADRAMRLPTDIQYWAGVIMRNACRKDENRGGIRQCANMGCGVWEKFQREFAKCRRCRKAKYCSKGCQRRAWQAGHRYWCSARQDTPPQQPMVSDEIAQVADNVAVQIATNNAAPLEEEGGATIIAEIRGGAEEL